MSFCGRFAVDHVWRLTTSPSFHSGTPPKNRRREAWAVCSRQFAIGNWHALVVVGLLSQRWIAGRGPQ